MSKHQYFLFQEDNSFFTFWLAEDESLWASNGEKLGRNWQFVTPGNATPWKSQIDTNNIKNLNPKYRNQVIEVALDDRQTNSYLRNMGCFIDA